MRYSNFLVCIMKEVFRDMQLRIIAKACEELPKLAFLGQFLVLCGHQNIFRLFSFERTPCVKFRKYFNFAGMSENMFQSVNMEVYEKSF